MYIDKQIQVMKNKLLALVAVFSFFAWGSIAWATGDFILAGDNLPLLNLLRNTTYVVAALAVLLRFYLSRVSDKTYLLVGGGVCAFTLISMVRGEAWVPVGYLVIGLTRIILVPATLGATVKALGNRGGVVATAGGFYLTNAISKPIVANLVERGVWRTGLLVAAGLTVLSALASWGVHIEEQTADDTSGEGGSHTHLGSGLIVFVLIQVTFGVVTLGVFPIAETLYGDVTDAGFLEAARQWAMLIGVLATLLYPGRISFRLMLFSQAAGLLAILLGVYLHIKWLVIVGLVIEGVTFALLERASELAYLEGVQGVARNGFILQLVDAASRLAIIPGETAVPFLPLQVTLVIAALMPLCIIALLATPLKAWLGRKLLEFANQ